MGGEGEGGVMVNSVPYYVCMYACIGITSE